MKILKSTLFAIMFMFTGMTVFSQARVQVIHNSADAAAAVVDVWLNNTLLIDNFAFRTATPFIDAPAGVEFTIAIKGPDSQNASNPIWSKNYTLAAGETYILVADGIVSASGYMPNEDFDLEVYVMGREAANMTTKTDVLVHHGSTDAPDVDIYETGIGAGLLIDDLEYSDFAGYLELAPLDYVIEVRDETGISTVASYSAPLQTLGLQGAAITVIASGFLNPANNSNGPAFGLFVASANGGNLLPLPTYTPPSNTARVQVIHNSADAAAAVVDVWLNNTLLIDNFAFRTAKPFIDAPAGVEFTIAIKGPDSQNASNPIWSKNYTLAAGETYILVADGIVSASGYTPAPAFDLFVYGQAREMAGTSTNVDVLVFHGTTDAPTVDIAETGVGAGTIVDNISYGQFAGYLELPSANYVLAIQDETGNATVASFAAPLADLGIAGQSLTVLASGFLTPENNSNGPAFSLLAVLANGNTLMLTPSSINESPVNLASFKVFPNPATDQLNISFDMKESSDVSVDLMDVTGRTLDSRKLSANWNNTYNLKMDVREIPTGLYMLNIKTTHSVVSKKVLVQ
jgi:hypothetical protein